MPKLLTAAASIILAIVALSACGGQTSSQTTPTRPKRTAELCKPPVVGPGEPVVAVVLLDGAPSQESGGNFLPIAHPGAPSGIPLVTNYCPLDPTGVPRGWPAGLDSELRRWSEFSVGTGSGSPDHSDACTLTGGFHTDSCLVARLADAGAVLLPFSYHPGGDWLDANGVFHHLTYTNADATAGSQNALGALTNELASIHRVWPGTHIIVVGHSYGGLVSELWWAGVRPALPDHGGVVHVFTLDSPVNGVPKASLIGPVLGKDNARFFQQRWLSQVNTAHILLALDRDDSLTLVGSIDDPTYSDSSITGGGGTLYAQTVVNDSTGQPHAVPPVGVAITDPRCDGSTGDYYGTTHHDLVKACPQIVRMIVAAVSAQLSAAPGPTTTTATASTPTATTTTTTSPPSPTTGQGTGGCLGVACATTNEVTLVITSVKRSRFNNYGEDLVPNGQFFVRMGVRVIDHNPQPTTVDNMHFGLLDAKHIVDSPSDEGFGSKCGLSGNGDPGITRTQKPYGSYGVHGATARAPIPAGTPMTRLALTRHAPQHIEHYAEQTRRVVDDVAAQLQVLFEDERAGRMSPSWARTLDRLFSLWCEQSGIVRPDTARSVLEGVDALSLTDVLKAVRGDLGFSSDDVAQACEEYVARARAGRPRSTLLRRLEQRLYRPQIRSLCVQSAHVALARVVLYRVLEDVGIAQRRISGPPLASALAASAEGLVGAPSVFSVLDDMRADSEDFLPSLYQRRELDWWLIEFPRGGRRQALFDQRMGAVEVELARMLQVLDGYDFAGVDQDVWRDVYEHHLPWDERQRLGSFYTPDAIVREVLDLVVWIDTNDAISDATIADISCGSGAFLVEALRRRRIALARAGRLPRDPAPEQLDHLVSGMVGLDIHPFATFLASVNVLFQVIDLYESVRRRHRGYSLPLNVFTVDSLEDAGVHPRQAELQQDIPEDIRIRHTEEEIARYQQVRTRRFDTVVGNPPWGGVLKGRLSPLNDPDKRREYAGGRFESATGKYDIFVLFVERSIRWLADGGHYGFVIPSAYRDRGFGQGLRQFLASEATPTTIVDLLPFGGLLFRAMNTPTLLAGTRRRTDSELRVVSVDRDFVFTAAPSERESRHRELGDAINAALGGQSGQHVLELHRTVGNPADVGTPPMAAGPTTCTARRGRAQRRD